MSALSLQTLGMLPDTANHTKSALHLQTLGHLHALEAVTQPPTQPQAQAARGGGGGLPAWRRALQESEALVPLDTRKMAGETFAETFAQRVAIAIARLSTEEDG